MATQIVELSGDEAALLRSYDRAVKKQAELEAKLRAGGDAGASAGTQIEDALAKVQRANDQALKSLLADLRTLGPEGAAAAEAMKGHLVDAGKAGFRSVDNILASIREIDPTAADAAAAARQSLVDAANSSETQFRDVLDELKAMGPEGRQAAEQIKQSLVAAGKLSEKSIEDVARALHKIDPEAAKAADAIVANMKNSTNSMSGMFSTFGKHAVAEITGIVTAYIGVQEAIQLVNEYLTTQREKVLEVAAAQTELAAAQENASKNLAGLQRAERLGLLEQAPVIAMQAGIDPKIITEALGTVASTGLNDPQKIANIVTQSAKLNRLTPEELPSSAAGAADIMAKTGLEDIRQTSALFLTTGAQSLVADPAKLQAALPRALGAGIISAPGQNREDAARETAAIFAQATNVGTDTQGSSSATFTIDLLNRMSQFFDGLERERVQARSRIELTERKIAKGKDTEFDRLKMQEDQAFLKASEGVQDPGTQFGRLAILQGSKELAQQFTGEKGFGEKQFAPFLKEILDSTSKTAAALQASKESIRADVAAFEQQADELVNSTSAISTAVAEKELAAVRQAGQLLKTDEGALGVIRKQVSETLAATNVGGVQGFFDWAIDDSSRMGANASDAALEAIQRLQVRKGIIAMDGITGEDATNIQTIDATIQRVFGFLGRDIQAGAIDRDSARRTATEAASLATRYDLDPEYRANLKRLATLLEQVAANTAATAATNAAMVQPAQDTANNTGKTPTVAGAIGSAAAAP